MTSADFNNDGKVDLAIAGGSNNVWVLLGTGTGNFAPFVNFSAANSPTSIFAATINADTKTDLAVGNGSSSNVSILLNCTAVGIDNYSNESIISVYPNPTSDQFLIDANTTDILSVDLYDVNGRHVFSARISDRENINVTSLENGIYSLTIKSVDHVTNKKLVIVR